MGTVGCCDAVAAAHSSSYFGTGKRLGFPSSSFSFPASMHHWQVVSGASCHRDHGTVVPNRAQLQGSGVQRGRITAPSGPWEEAHCLASYCWVCHESFLLYYMAGPKNPPSGEVHIWVKDVKDLLQLRPSGVDSFVKW